MSKIQILSNTNFQLEKVIKNELMEADTVRIAVAFLKKTGLDLVKKQLDFALSQKTNIEFIVGLDFKTTDYKALNELEKIKQENETFKYYCFGDKGDNYNSLIFHPKIYLFNSNNKYTSIVGSSNFTGGGLSTNFEVNTIFQETNKNYQYFSQLETIYKEIKFQDSIFIPNRVYLDKYSLTIKEIEKFGKKAINSKTIKDEIKFLQKESLNLEGTIPSLKRIIIELMKSNINKVFNIKDIYIYCENYIINYNLQYKFQSKDLRATIRGELNKHEIDSKHKDNMQLFKRENKGFYHLSILGLKYEKR
ncbi:MAG: phospholipase D family protein [Sulfurovum sp.]